MSRPMTAEQRLAVRQVEDVGAHLINVGIHAVRKNPIKMGFWCLGLLICVFFNGIQVSDQQLAAYESAQVRAGEFSGDINDASRKMWDSDVAYRNSQGWFWSCNQQCQVKKSAYLEDKREYDEWKSKEREALRNAKAAVGLFSPFGVGNARHLFNDQFQRGKSFAARQSKWDALFLGFRAMARDESFVNYAFSLLFNLLVNFTIGVMGALLGFLWNLWSLVVEYRASIITAIAFFFLASLAAFSFAAAWLAGLYAAAAGTVYVGAKFVAANMTRLEDGRGGLNRNIRYDE